MDVIQQHKDSFDKTIEFLKHEIAGLRTGRASPALVEDIPVEAYGTRQPVKAVASISVADAKTLAVEPWDKSLMQAVEVGIRNSSLGLNPANDGHMIRVILPDLTQDRRIELIKLLHQKLEIARVAVRKLREDIRKGIDTSEKNKEIGEDVKFKMQEHLEKMVKEYNEKIQGIGADKEREITTI